jgi:hypothetical protein
VHRAFSVGGAIYAFVVNGYETRVASELQIGFNESSAEGDSFLERGQSIFGRVTGGSAMSDQQHAGAPPGASATLGAVTGFLSVEIIATYTLIS